MTNPRDEMALAELLAHIACKCNGSADGFCCGPCFSFKAGDGMRLLKRSLGGKRAIVRVLGP